MSVMKRDLHSSCSPYRIEVGIKCEDPSRTRQEFAEECDINAMMARYQKEGGMWPPREWREPQYLDLANSPGNLLDAMETMHRATEAFNGLPAEVRREFENDPFQFVEFAADPENLPQMRTWGLAAPEKVPDAPMRVEVVSPAPADSPAPAPAAAGASTVSS